MPAERKRRTRTRRGTSSPSSVRNKTVDKSDLTEDEIKEIVPRGLTRAFVDSKLRDKRVREAGLTPPSDFTDDMPELPKDIAAVDHNELSQLMIDFQNAFSTATWRASMAYIAHDIYDEISEYLENRALLESSESNDTKRKADARTSDTVVSFRGFAKQAYHDYVSYRDLGKTIEGKIKVVSRVGGFKDDEQEASDRSAKPKMSRGSARGTTRLSRNRD